MPYLTSLSLSLTYFTEYNDLKFNHFPTGDKISFFFTAKECLLIHTLYFFFERKGCYIIYMYVRVYVHRCKAHLIQIFIC